MNHLIEDRTYEALNSLRTRLPFLRDALECGSRRRWSQREPSPAQLERMNRIARLEREDRAANIAAGITALGASPAPLRLEVLDTERAVHAGLAELDAVVCEWLALEPMSGVRPVETVTRLISLLGRIARHPELAEWVLEEARRLNRVVGAAIGDVEMVKRLDARCPVCDSRSLRALPERGLVSCANPACRCGEPACQCAEGRRHTWPFDHWPELAARLAATA